MNAYRALRGFAGTALVLGCLTGWSETAGALTVTDPALDFIPTFGGDHNGDVDILSASLSLSGNNLLFSATLNGTIGTAGNTYVLGINRGLSTRNFSAVSSSLAGVTFDSTLTVTGAGGLGGTDSVANVGITAPFQISGNNITAVIPLTTLPIVPGGFASADQFLWNFWTRGSRQGVAVAGNAGFADFAPDSSDARLVTPLPAALPLFASGAGVFGYFGWRRKRKAAISFAA